MKTMILMSLFATTTLLTSCSTNSTVADHDQQADPTQAVTVFTIKPAGAQTIGTISTNSYTGLTLNQVYQDALHKLQCQAGQMGANGLVIESTNDAALMGARITAEAIFVPALNNWDGLAADENYWYLKK